MKSLLLLAIGLLVPTADAGKKKKSDSAEASAPVETQTGLTGDFPSDAASQAFAEKLVALQISDFRAVDGAGANVVFSSMSFAGDNTWGAVGYTDFGDERMDCKESGKWSMEPASSKTEATVVWTVEKTDCVGREAGVETRMAVELTGDGWTVAFR
ncbi:MAG: hypothetical protein H6742_02255 [Alphaproteobacteria bacterium]|nr:hypothetical protein [Alphaproteobacteria bacterium]